MSGGLKILDWDEKGNVVRLFLGKMELENWWGDDWDDTPRSFNAGPVYERFVTSHIDIAFLFDVELSRADDHLSKRAMFEGLAPMFGAVETMARLGRVHHWVHMGAGLNVLNQLPADILSSAFDHGGRGV